MLRYSRQVSHLSAMFLQVSEIGSQFPGKSYLPHSSNETGAAVSQILSVALLIGAVSLQANCGIAKQRALSSFNKANALFVHVLPLNRQRHEGKINGYWKGPNTEVVLNSLSHLRFRVSESGPVPSDTCPLRRV